MRLFRGSKALRFCYFFSCYSGFKGFRERFERQGLKRISGFWEGLREGWF
jgi:hypothetical protein